MNCLDGREHIERLNQLVATPNHLNPMIKVEAGPSYRGTNSKFGDTLAFWSNGRKKRCIGDNDKDDKNDKV